MESNGIFGIMDTVIFDVELTQSEASDIVHVITHIIKQRLINILPANCIQTTDPLDTLLNNNQNVNKINKLTVNISVFVCNKVQQQQLVLLSDTNNINMRCQMVYTIQQQLGLSIPFNTTSFQTIAITQYQSIANSESTEKQ